MIAYIIQNIVIDDKIVMINNIHRVNKRNLPIDIHLTIVAHTKIRLLDMKFNNDHRSIRDIESTICHR